jgi:hypothetical protein
MDFAERLGLWVSAFDAIRLQGALQEIEAIDAPAPARPRMRPVRAQTLDEDVRRVRSALAHAIAQELLPLRPEPPRSLTACSSLPPEGAGLAWGGPAQRPEADQGFAPYHQRHLELQRQMEQMIRPLRAHVREALSAASTGLRKLAALDTALDDVLAPREQTVMPATATLLKRRFEQQRKAGEPIGTFENDWRQALLAEVDLRLEPVRGLVEALHHELTDAE